MNDYFYSNLFSALGYFFPCCLGRTTAGVKVATEVRHTRNQIKCARTRERVIQRIEEATSKDTES